MPQNHFTTTNHSGSHIQWPGVQDSLSSLQIIPLHILCSSPKVNLLCKKNRPKKKPWKSFGSRAWNNFKFVWNTFPIEIKIGREISNLIKFFCFNFMPPFLIPQRMILLPNWLARWPWNALETPCITVSNRKLSLQNLGQNCLGQNFRSKLTFGQKDWILVGILTTVGHYFRVWADDKQRKVSSTLFWYNCLIKRLETVLSNLLI